MADQFHPTVLSTNSTNVHQQLLDMQRNHSESLLATHHQIAAVMSLPLPLVPKFNGDPIEYSAFVLAFDTRISSRVTTNADRLYYLQQQLEGIPRELISGCLHMQPDDGYAEARNLLQREYGNSHKVSMAFMNKVLEWPSIKPDEGSSLTRFCYFLIKCQYAMQNITDLAVLNHTPNLQAIVRKLPFSLQNKWREYVHKLTIREQRFVQFNDLVAFIKDAAETINEPVFSKHALHGGDPSKQSQRSNMHATVKNSSFVMNASSIQKHYDKGNQQPVTNNCCRFCEHGHSLDECEAFNNQPMDVKRKFFK